MSPGRPLSELLQVKARFYRSVSLVADYNDPAALSDYIFSPLGRTVLRRITEGLRPDSRVRAWSIVGPYGAGKSAFALFLARVLGYPRNAEAQEQLRAADADLYGELEHHVPGWSDNGFVIVPILGSREPLAVAVLRGLRASLRSVGPQLGLFLDEAMPWLDSLYERAEQGEPIPAATLTEAVERMVKTVSSASGQVSGMLIVVDELGKLLEHAAQHPSEGDVFLLQALAEQASRSGDTPVGLVVILHQAFERYAARLSPLQQREWAKVQGRFEEIGFLESPGELLRLLGQAVQRRQPLDGFASIVAEEVAQAKELNLAPRELGWGEAEAALSGCAPLHPTVSLVLGRLFRSRLAQNERSLFAFLTSGEPHGFQEYLHRETWDGDERRSFYGLDQLYDYVTATLGSALYSLPQGKKWAEIEDALERLPRDSEALEAQLVKAIGLLGLLGDQRYLKASTAVLGYALGEGCDAPTYSVDAALERLCAWGIAIYRQHKDAYSLWEGSDIDLEERFQKGLDQVDRAASLASLLRDCGQLRPYVAKRYQYETGTLRYFVPRVVGTEDLDAVRNCPLDGADGAIVFVVDSNGTAAAQAIQAVLDFSSQLPSPRRDLLLFAIPQDTFTLRQALEEVQAWDWVARNTPELEGDAIARKELAGRQIDAEGRLNRLCTVCFERTSAHGAWQWIYAGQIAHFGSAGELSAFLSDVCDKVYHAAPVVLNELVNRRTLSSAAAAARRKLIEIMVSHRTEPRLGIVGFPPELSMYRSVLEVSGLHHAQGPVWEFGLSDRYSVGRIEKLWEAIDGFLDATEAGKRSVAALFELLREPPYGVKDGLLPIYLTAAALHWEAEVALYENGSFIPKVDIATLERLIKAPDQFAIQRYRLGEARSYLFEKYAELLGRGPTSPSQTTLLTAVRPLLAFARHLPTYTQLTGSLRPETLAVREAVLTAREPHRLLFEDLPSALHRDPGQVNADLVEAHDYFAALRAALLELQRAYDELLTTIQAQLGEALRLPAEMTTTRAEAVRRAALLHEHVADLRLKAFVLRLGDQQLPDKEWLESVASCVANKPPKEWSDVDVLRFQTDLAEMSGRFRRVEEIVLDGLHQGEGAEGASVIRLGVTALSGEEQRDVVSILPQEESEVRALADELDAAMRRTGAPDRLRIAALAELVRRVLGPSSPRQEEERR